MQHPFERQPGPRRLEQVERLLGPLLAAEKLGAGHDAVDGAVGEVAEQLVGRLGKAEVFHQPRDLLELRHLFERNGAGGHQLAGGGHGRGSVIFRHGELRLERQCHRGVRRERP